MLLVFAPTDDAIYQLSSKPWSFPYPVDSESANAEETTQANVRSFVESHIVETSDLDFSGSKTAKLQSINGNIIKLKNFDDGFKVGLPDVAEWLSIENIEILDNGAVLTISKTLSWPGRY
ncbi:unnamed protein product [Ambrosiozyma monospora]|uniref:Unnamed protein product n=1 Tax=Ambrosiozyma monospora TaxID=43982 RepID=A0ACB5T2S5_AMBMO|nr:unnamed protein product [Ambrosiozyma monospora]